MQLRHKKEHDEKCSGNEKGRMYGHPALKMSYCFEDWFEARHYYLPARTFLSFANLGNPFSRGGVEVP